MKNTLGLALLALAAGANAQLIIDDFSIPYSKEIASGSNVDVNSGAVLTGERDVEMRVISNPFAQHLRVSITGSQLAVVSNGFGLSSTLKLQYDGVGDEAANLGVNKTLLNSGGLPSGVLQGNNQVAVRFLDNDLPVQVKAVLRQDGGIIAQQTAARAAMAGAGAVVFNFAQADANNADSITFEFQADPSGDYALEGIEAVPEPATMTALGLGLAAIAARRRKK